MRIAFLTPEFVTEKKFDGGLANYLQRTALSLKQMGHEPEVFVTSERTETIDLRGIPVHRVQLYSPLDWRIQKIGIRLFRLPWFMSWEAFCVARALSRGLMLRHAAAPFDIVQTSDFHATGLLVPPSERFTLVCRLSYYAPAYRKAYERPATADILFREKLEVRSIKKAHFVYAPSAMMAELVAKELGIRVDVVHPSFVRDVAPQDEDASVYEKELKGKRYVLFFGRLSRLKGTHILAKAMSGVLAQTDGLYLVLVGRQDPPGILGELHGLLGETASSRTIHLERLRHPQLFPVIRHAECVCLPSRIDNFPNTCLEAMSLGRIVIGTRGTGFEDLIRDGKDGLLENPDDHVSLAATLNRILNCDAETRSRMEAASAHRVADFAPDRMIPQLVSYYQWCLESRGKQGTSRT